MQDHLPISVKEARKLLGYTDIELSDDQVIEVILALKDIADNFINKVGSKI